MPGRNWLLPALLVGLAVLALSWELVSRRRSRGGASAIPLPPPATQNKVLIRLLCAFLCAVGAIGLIPWAAFLPTSEPSGLLPGLLILALLSIGALYALRNVGTGE